VAIISPLSTTALERELRARRWTIALAATFAAALAGVAVAQLILGNAMPMAVLAALAVATMVWFAPWTGVVVLVVAATVVEQFSLVSEGTFSDGTDHLVLFQSLNAGAGLGGIYASPFELFLALLIGVWLIKGFATRSLRLPKSALGAAVGAFGALVALGWLRGVTGGGSFQDALLELRPWMYLTISFIAASQLLTEAKHVMVVLTAFVVGVGIKSLQGILTLVAHFDGRPQAILAHEESFFFGLFLGVLAALWLIPIPGPLRRVMTVLAPFVLIADVGNQRRTAWAIAALVMFVAFALCFWGFPKRRRTIIVLGVIGCVLAGVYWLKFSNDPGLLGQPARAVLSQLAPQARDQQSNQYRTIENVNLGVGIRQATPFGTGFGHPIPQTVPNVDISNIDSFISYLPHNGVLYVWLRLGLPGIIAFWMMVGIGLMTGANLVRRRPNALALLIGLTLTLALVAYVVQGFYDMGLYWFRIAILIGCLMGAAQAIPRLNDGGRTKLDIGAGTSVSRKVDSRDLRSAA
jgi:hypothetical protein